MPESEEVVNLEQQAKLEQSYVAIRDLCEMQRKTIDRLQEIVDRLPKTADGVPITPWMPVWIICSSGIASVRISWVSADQSRVGTNSGWSAKPSDCYSTREAAEKARSNPC